MFRDLIIVAIIAVVIGLGLGWVVQGWRKDRAIATMQAEYAEQRAEAENTARIKEQGWQDAATKIEREKNAQIATVNRRLSTAIAGLRIRPERTTPTGEMPTTPGACFGLSGAELARGDGEFLVGYSADAARLETALKQCKAQYNSIGQ